MQTRCLLGASMWTWTLRCPPSRSRHRLQPAHIAPRRAAHLRRGGRGGAAGLGRGAQGGVRLWQRRRRAAGTAPGGAGARGHRCGPSCRPVLRGAKRRRAGRPAILVKNKQHSYQNDAAGGGASGAGQPVRRRRRRLASPPGPQTRPRLRGRRRLRHRRCPRDSLQSLWRTCRAAAAARAPPRLIRRRAGRRGSATRTCPTRGGQWAGSPRSPRAPMPASRCT